MTTDRSSTGRQLWRDLFNPRQLYGHCVSVEVFQDMVAGCAETDLDRAAMAYIALAIDKMVSYNAIQARGSCWRLRPARLLVQVELC